jgi:hypothetical protein
MSVPKIRKVTVARRTVGGRRFYPWHEIMLGIEVRFSKTWKTCTLPDGTVLKRAKGLGYWVDKNGDEWGLTTSRIK